LGKRLITEADVLKMSTPGELLVDKDTIITPAAKDTAYLKDIKVVYRRAASEDTGAKNNDTSEKDKKIARMISPLKNGAYFLQIDGDRVRIFEVRDDGVFPVSDKSV